jgi:MFS family permease
MIFLLWGVEEPPRGPAPLPAGHRWRAAAGLGRAYWAVVALGTVFTLARFSEAFLVLLGHARGLAPAQAPVVMIALGVIYAMVAYPAGALGDRAGARGLLGAGLGVLVAADLVLALAVTPAQVLAGAALWGAHLGLTQGLMSKLVADAAPAALRGTAFGVFNLATGLALGLASMLAGLAWTAWGAPATFLIGALFAGLALLGLLLVRPAAS